ncbi:lysophospholipid acyltransferase family protein [Chloroflexota bacterium]
MEKKPYRVSFWRRWLSRPVVRFILRSIFFILAPIKIIGKENIPLGKPYILAMNHVSIFDPPFIVSYWPEMVESLGAAEVWKKPGQGFLAVLYGGIPVHREDVDRNALEIVLNALQSGYPVLIAPEGGRSHTPAMIQAKPGIAFIAELSGTPVLPVGIVGTTEDFWHNGIRGRRPELELRIGKPMILPPVKGKGRQRKENRQKNADLVMATIAGLLPEEYRGVYADRAIEPS